MTAPRNFGTGVSRTPKTSNPLFFVLDSSSHLVREFNQVSFAAPMKLSHLAYFSLFGVSTILFHRRRPILGTIIVTDRCNLHCRHCSVNNLTAVMHPFEKIRGEMRQLYEMGVRILFFCGGETFLWRDGALGLRDLVREAKAMGFFIVNVVTNGTQRLDLPEADLILLSLDGDERRHNLIRGETYALIRRHIAEATSDNICLYMAINQLNKSCIRSVCEVARDEPTVRAVSFNFHTPYPDTAELALSRDEKAEACREIEELMDEGFPIFNLRSAFPAIVDNAFPTPCRQCVVMEDGKLSVCGRCIDVPGLCERCGYFFAAEYALVFRGEVRVIAEMLRTYTRYV